MAGYDAIVIGVGGMGSAAVYHLAKRGLKVLGLEQFEIPHELGSSHGHSRMIRYTLQEHPSYVPLVRRAYELWHELEQNARETLVVTTGSVRAGPVSYTHSEPTRPERISYAVFCLKKKNRTPANIVALILHLLLHLTVLTLFHHHYHLPYFIPVYHS